MTPEQLRQRRRDRKIIRPKPITIDREHLDAYMRFAGSPTYFKNSAFIQYPSKEYDDYCLANPDHIRLDVPITGIFDSVKQLFKRG